MKINLSHKSTNKELKINGEGVFPAFSEGVYVVDLVCHACGGTLDSWIQTAGDKGVVVSIAACTACTGGSK